MTNTKTTKRALIASVLSLLVCVSMLIGSTFAWFTDSATTGLNVIKSGNLEIAFEYADGTEDPTAAAWLNAEGAMIFDYEKWEPGYTVAKHIRISNKGSLALKYQLDFMLDGEIGKLAEAIDVYFKDGGIAVSDRATVDTMQKVGTLKAFLENTVANPESGKLLEGESDIVTIVLKMQEGANNDYQEQTVGKGLTVAVIATQATAESDSFDDQYDKNALFGNERMVSNDAELATAINEAMAGADIDSIYLNGNFGAITLPHGVDGISLIATGNARSATTVGSINVNGAKNLVIEGITFNAAEAQQTYQNPGSRNNITTPMLYTASVYDNRKVVNGSETLAAKNITIKNCVFTGTATVDVENEKGYVPVYFDDSGAGTRIADITVEGCTFNCNAVSYVIINSADENGFINIVNNTFGGAAYSNAWAAVAVQQLNNVDVKIADNTFYNWDSADGAVKVSKKSGSPTAPTATVTGNTFNGAVADNACVIEIRRAGSTSHTISGNTYNITDRALDDGITEVRDDNTKPSNAVAVWYRQANS